MSNRNTVLNALRKDGSLISILEDYQGDKEAILISLEENGTNIKYATRELKCDKEIIYKAIKKNEKAYYNLPTIMKKDVDLFVELIRVNPYILKVTNDFTREEMFMIYRRIDKEFSLKDMENLKPTLTERQNRMLYAARKVNLNNA